MRYFVGSLLLVFSGNSFADEVRCGDILKWGIFNEETLDSGEEMAAAYHRFQCTNELRNREEASALGFGVDVPIEGVPVGLDLATSNQARDSWRKANCSQIDLQHDSSRHLNTMKRLVSEAITKAWSGCVDAQQKISAAKEKQLRCEIVRGDENSVTLALERLRKDDTSVKIRSVTSRGIRAAGLPAGGSAFPLVETTFVLKRVPPNQGKISPVVIDFNTTSGSCVALFPEFVELHRTTRIVTTSTIAGDTIIRAENVVLPANTKLRVANGARLRIEAHKITLGANVEIDGTGASGAAGANAPASAEVRTVYGSHGPGDACAREVDNNRNSHLGTPGGNGQDGGRGARLEFVGTIEGELATLVIKNAGGAGGEGGAGGLGPRMSCIFEGKETWSSILGKPLHGTRGKEGEAGPAPQLGGEPAHHFVQAPD